jgi:hypothetical protein
MSKESIGPERIRLLETYVKCLKRAERRIKLAGYIAQGGHPNIENYFVQRPLILHIAACVKARGIMGHGSALMCLQIARSKYARELEGL